SLPSASPPGPSRGTRQPRTGRDTIIPARRLPARDLEDPVMLRWCLFVLIAGVVLLQPVRADDAPARSAPKVIDAGIPVWSVAFADGTRTLLAAGDSDTLKVFDLDAKKVLPLRGHNKVLEAGAVAPDGKRWAPASHDTTVVVWDAAKREELFTLKGHTDVVRALAFSPDSQTLVTGGFDNTVRLWDVGSKKEIPVLRSYRHITALPFGPDGQTIGLGSEDGAVCFWDTAEPRKILPASRRHEKMVRCIAYAPDSKTAASCSDDGTAALWEVATGRALDAIAPK